MKELILIGAGGCMRELAWQIQTQETDEEWNVVGYVDKEESYEIVVGEQYIPYLGSDEYLLSSKEPVNVAICIGDPALREKIARKLKRNPYINFPNILLSGISMCSDLKLGEGCIISRGCSVSTNVTLGDFVFLNMEAMVCHDGRIGSFTTLSPRATMAGNVSVGESCYLGMGCTIRQGTQIGKNVMVGMGSVVINNVEENETIVGVPARPKR